jgi:hypothetical protein
MAVAARTFVYISAVEKAGFTSLAEGAKVSYRREPRKTCGSRETCRSNAFDDYPGRALPDPGRHCSIASSCTEKQCASCGEGRRNNPSEQNRHPEDVALDRGIKGICRGC